MTYRSAVAAVLWGCVSEAKATAARPTSTWATPAATSFSPAVRGRQGSRGKGTAGTPSERGPL